MTIKNLFIALLAFAAFACQDNQDITTGPDPDITPTPGQDVQFGGGVNKNSLTRTVYGDEANNAFPIYWLKGDRVVVTSPQCALKQGTYQVPDEAYMRDYAGQFGKVGNAGIQWGQEATADFYSIYPTASVTPGSNLTSFTMTIPSEQVDTIIDNGTKTLGMKPNMEACFMYAKTVGAQNGSTVNLGYRPLSTAIRFTLSGPSTQNNPNSESATITHIVLHAPEGTALAGDFTVELSGGEPVVTPGANTTNELLISPVHQGSQAYLTLAPDEQVELNAFVIPQSGIKITDRWFIEFTLSNGKRYRKNLAAEDGTAGDKVTLVAGKIHRLPPMPQFAFNNTWNSDDWMVNIPRNVYLSEVSLPGSWNTVNSNFQSTRDIDAQYAIGVRAFHLDVCWRARSKGVFQGKEIIDLGVADGSSRSSFSGLTGPQVMGGSATQFEAALKAITDNVKDNEYMVVMCSFAQDSYDWPDKTWMQAISDECAANSKVIDGRTITQNTTVADVLGKVIVIVGCEQAVSGLTLPADSKCIFSHLPMTLTQSQFVPYTANLYNKDDIYKSDKTSTGIQFYNVHSQVHKYSGDTGSSNTGDRGYAPSFAEHEAIAGNVLDWSRQNYENINFNHNAWIYLGLGGYCIVTDNFIGNGTPDSGGRHHEVAKRLSGWIGGKIDNMSSRPTDAQTGFFPVGIVLLNFVNSADDYGPATVEKIYQLNTKYRQAYDEGRSPIDGSVLGSSDISPVAPGYSAGMADGGEDAFGWSVSK